MAGELETVAGFRRFLLLDLGRVLLALAGRD